MSQNIYLELYLAEAQSRPFERPHGGTSYAYEWTDDTLDNNRPNDILLTVRC